MRNIRLKRYICPGITALAITVTCSQPAAAGSYFATLGQDWKQIAAEDSVGSSGYVGPGYGGQSFYAEYLAYKIDGNKLTIGLQSGFDLGTGLVQVQGDSHKYYAGDLALSFDPSPTTYEYAFDFGLLTKDYSNPSDFVDADPIGQSDGIDIAGLYSVSQWNTDIYYSTSNPFAMDGGVLVNGANGTTMWGMYNGSYWRTVTFNITPLNLGDMFTLGAHWTMSCGNDVLNGTGPGIPVPEPGFILLFGTGLMGFVGYQRRRLKK